MSNRTKITETAVLTVNGQKYEDWESVLVKHEKQANPPYRFRFTCSEGMPLASNWAKLQIRPGDKCTVTLAGILAISGTVDTRQVVYDANRHHIEIQGGSLTEMATASVVTKTGEFNNSTFEQITRAVLKPLKINLKVEGGALPKIKIPRASVAPGQNVYDFLDELARGLKTETGSPLAFTSNPQGDFVVIAGQGQAGQDAVIEGINIIMARSIIFNPNVVGSSPSLGQPPGNDEKWGARPNQTVSPNMFKILSPNQNPLSTVILSEVPAWSNQFTQGRARAEQGWLSDDEITVFATVYGWLRPSGGLWWRDQDVLVTSPMLIMKGEKLKAKSVTFTQDNTTGSRTTLELCNENAMKGQAPSLGGK